VAADLDDYIKGGFASLECPASGTYTIGDMSTDPVCSVAGHVLP